MIAPIAGTLAGLILDVPVDPDGDQAREWIMSLVCTVMYYPEESDG